MLKIGTVPYKDNEENDSSRVGRHHDVIVAQVGGSYKVQAAGYAEGSLPPADTDLAKVIKAGKKFIHRNGGSGLKKVKPSSSPQRDKIIARRANEGRRRRDD